MSSQLATTKMSSKGQIVIPESIRLQMGLEAGAQFVVLAENDVVVLKAITPPPRQEFNDLLKRVRKQAKEAGISKDDLSAAIADVRGRGKK